MKFLQYINRIVSYYVNSITILLELHYNTLMELYYIKLHYIKKSNVAIVAFFFAILCHYFIKFFMHASIQIARTYDELSDSYRYFTFGSHICTFTSMTIYIYLHINKRQPAFLANIIHVSRGVVHGRYTPSTPIFG